MWYVIQTYGGEEERTASMISKIASSGCLEECFVPKRERMRKFHGCWNIVEEILFHGYVFVISERPDKLYEELKGIPRLTKVLGREDENFIPLSMEEEKMVRGIGDQKHKTSLSKIEIREEKQIRIIDGPLKKYIENIVKVDLHRRDAAVKVNFMGRETELKMGIEIV